VPINYKLHPREMLQILDDGGVSPGVRLAEACGRTGAADGRSDRNP